MKIAYFSTDNIMHRSSFDVGTRYYIGKYLSKHLGEVDFLAPLHTIKNDLLFRTKRRVYKYIFGKRYFPERAPRVLDHYTSQVEKMIQEQSYDLIFSPDSMAISHLDIDIPIVFYTDAVFDAMIDFYPEYTNLCMESVKDGHRQEQAALDRATLAIYSSQWAVDAAISSFDVDPDKVRFIPFGANLRRIPDQNVLAKRGTGGTCKLLFVGKDWVRKGGPVAVRAVQALNGLGVESSLFVCSQLPRHESVNEFVNYIGLLDRNKEKQNRQLEDLFSSSHFLILPTLADCTPGVFREAAAFGLPVITTDVGGNRSVVTHGKSGIILSKDADAEEYASVIMENYTNDGNYTYLCVGAREMFEQVLNWDSSIAKVSSLIRNLLGSS
jgi:glycosyltransferase involved in cell wall biosynthesis